MKPPIPEIEFAAWWQAYLAIYAALQLDDTRDENERQRTADERADQVMKVWHTKKRFMLDPEASGSADIAKEIYLREKAKSELKTKIANGSEIISETSVTSPGPIEVGKDHVPEKNPQ